MANVRLLRQLVDDYAKRVNSINEEYGDKRSIYEKAIDSYNATITSAREGTEHLSEMAASPGEYGVFGGVDEFGNLGYKGKATIVDNLEALGKSDFGSIVYGTDGAAPRMFVRNADGTATQYVMPESTSDGPRAWTAVGTYNFLPSEVPAAPEVGDPRGLNLTEKEKGLLQNPTLLPSEMNIASAKGEYAQSQLAGEQASTPNSAFANPDDPNNLKERGVLARVLGGQL